MKKVLFEISLVIGLVFGYQLNALADYVGSSSEPVLKTVSEVKKSGKDDQPVVLVGYIIKKVGKEKYIFKDSTGEIRVEIDRKNMPTKAFDEKTKVEISGEIEKEFLHSVEIDVDSIKFL
jgi:uncharacterized protein (TIGR00156 family)